MSPPRRKWLARHGLFVGTDIEPDAPAPCFCADCVLRGGAARERLRARYFGNVRDSIERRGARSLPT